ncbi:restriction endonuclease subunit S, partial [Helicobacter himalayensis]|uniref:restriction endonuclease subunit S n=1 Tax=Helicobacter himalayensis TaxID=1591088 RepID=UPI003D6F64A4
MNKDITSFFQSLHKEQWQEVRLGEVAEKITSGGTPKSNKDEYYNGTIPWLNTKEVKNNRIYFTEKTITETGLANSSAKWIEKDSVIVAMYGATAGKVAINKIPLTTNQACCNITLDALKADYNFIYYTLLHNFNRLDQMTSGAAQQNLNIGLIYGFNFLLPPIETQQQIAEILSSFDDKIDLLHRQNKTLESLAQTLFAHTFIDNPKNPNAPCHSRQACNCHSEPALAGEESIDIKSHRDISA